LADLNIYDTNHTLIYKNHNLIEKKLMHMFEFFFHTFKLTSIWTVEICEIKKDKLQKKLIIKVKKD